SEFSVVVSSASGYGLGAIRHALVPVSGRVRRATIGAMAAVAMLHAATSPPLGLHPRYSVLQLVVLWLVVGLWAVCAGEPIVTFWRTAHLRPAVQRTRLRTLSAGTFGLGALILGYAWTAPRGSAAGASVVIAIAGLLLLPLL